MSVRWEAVVAFAAGAGVVLLAQKLSAQRQGQQRPAQAQHIESDRLQGKTVIVTGAASGIGKAICLRCVQEGANVVIFDMKGADDAPLEGGATTLQAISELGKSGAAIYVQGDTSKWEDVDKVVTQAVKQFGRLDVFVNNAAIGAGGALLDTSEADWDRVMNVNCKGYFFGCKRAIQQMLTQEMRNELRGRVINISSQHGMVCAPRDLAYGVGKSAAVYMTRQIAVDYATSNIAVNAVAPGKIVTGCDSDNRKYSLARTPAPRLGRPDDVAAAVSFLASDQASSFITGINLMVDGGFTAF